MRAHHHSWLGLLVCVSSACAQSPPPAPPPAVRPGIEVLLTDSAHLIAGQRLALLTNQTGVDRSGRRDIDRLIAHGARLTLLLSTEHGITGTEDREGLPDGVDSATGLPIYSMYGGTPLRQVNALDSVDVLLLDLQDIGARYYSYPAAAVQLLVEGQRRGKRVIVLDRPNPLDGVTLQGNLPAKWTQVSRNASLLAVPMRHGMTIGELARMANAELAIRSDVVVVPMGRWERGYYYDLTRLPWIKPSPNMPTLESALHYPGTCLFEATNLSVGRGTDFAFQVVGAPWLDAERVLAALSSLKGVDARAIAFTPRNPTDGKYSDQPLRGIRLQVRSRDDYDPTRTAVALLAAIHAVHGDSLQFRAARFDEFASGPELREGILAGRSAAELTAPWAERLIAFRRERAKYLLY